jgi:hypothetical protein
MFVSVEEGVVATVGKYRSLVLLAVFTAPGHFASTKVLCLQMIFHQASNS